MRIKALLFFLLCWFSLSSFANLDKAIEYVDAGEKDKAYKELLLIAELADQGHPKVQFEFGTMWAKEG